MKYFLITCMFITMPLLAQTVVRVGVSQVLQEDYHGCLEMWQNGQLYLRNLDLNGHTIFAQDCDYAVKISTNGVEIQNGTVIGARVAGIYSDGNSDINIHNVNIYGSNGDGIYIKNSEDAQIGDCDVSIKNNIVSYSSGHGICLNNVSTIDVSANQIYENDKQGLYILDHAVYAEEYSQVKSNTFSYNGFNGVKLESVWNLNFEANIIESNGKNGILGYDWNGPGAFEGSNTIRYNALYGVDLRQYSKALGFVPGNISGNGSGKVKMDNTCAYISY